MRRNVVKKRVVAIAAGLAIAGAVGASAATLGGLGGVDLGADTGDVGACDADGIDVDWTPVFNAASGQYVARFTLSDIDTDCLDTPYKLSIFEQGAGGSRAWIDADRFRFIQRYDRLPGPGVDQVFRVRYTSTFPAESVEGIAIEIGGRQL